MKTRFIHFHTIYPLFARRHARLLVSVGLSRGAQFMMEAWLDRTWLLYSCYVASLGLVHALFVSNVPEPYMDEPFHLRQTQEYCAGRWDVWDEKITTFPGLYILGAAVAGAIRSLVAVLGLSAEAADSACSLSSLRALNLLPAALAPWLIYELLHLRHPSASARDLKANAAVMSLLPTHFFFHFLYYTDSASTCSVLVLLLLSPYGQPARGVSLAARQLGESFSAATAIALRQTNAVWVAFAVASGSVRWLHRAALLAQHTPLFAALSQLFSGVARPVAKHLVAQHWPTLLLLAAFAAFLVVNGGVVVGDRTNHAPAFHLAQLLYLTVVVAAPHALWRAMPAAIPQTVRDAFAALRTATPIFAIFAIFASVGATALAAATTRSHPFLLADNRHVTFYVWRLVLGRHRMVPFVLAPVYALLGSLVYPSVWRAQGPLISLGLGVCSALVLVPSPLIELRYYTLPAMLLWLHAPPLRGAREWRPPLVAFALVNVAMLSIFLFRPYTWGDGSTARFMW